MSELYETSTCCINCMSCLCVLMYANARKSQMTLKFSPVLPIYWVRFKSLNTRLSKKYMHIKLKMSLFKNKAKQ